MDQAYKLANLKSSHSADYNKNNYDKKVKLVEIEVGDRVLLKNVVKGGTGKLDSYWEPTVYVVVSISESLPVYTIKSLEKNKVKTVHRNLIMKCNDLSMGEVAQPVKKMSMGEVAQPVKKISRNVKTRIECEIEDFSSEDEDDIGVICVRGKKKGGGRSVDVEYQEEVQEVNVENQEEEENVESQEEEENEEDVGVQNLEEEENEEDVGVQTEVDIQDVEGGMENVEDIQEVAAQDVDGNVLNEVEDAQGINVRRSTRERKPRQIFTYNEIGGKPIIE